MCRQKHLLHDLELQDFQEGQAEKIKICKMRNRKSKHRNCKSKPKATGTMVQKTIPFVTRLAYDFQCTMANLVNLSDISSS